MNATTKIGRDILNGPPDPVEVADTTTQKIGIRLISSLAEIEDLRALWTSWRNHPNADIDFYLTICRARTDFVRPYILVVDRNGSPEAMIIGRIEHRRLECKVGYKTVFRPKARVINFIYEGILGDLLPDASAIVVDMIMSSLRCGEADLAFFSLLRADSAIHEAAIRVPRFLSRDYSPPQQTHRSTTLRRNAEMFRALPRRIQRRNRKLVSDFRGQVRIVCFREPADLDRMIEDVEEVAKKTYQRGLGVGFVIDTVMRKRLQLEAEKGWLRGYVLYLGDRCGAFWIGTLYRGTFHTNFTGYDTSYSKYSPGMFLLMRAIEEMCTQEGRERVHNINWGLGDAEYKEILGTSQWQEGPIHIFAPTPSGLRLKLLVIATAMIEQCSKKVLASTGFLARMKKLWRDHVTQEEARPLANLP